MATQVATTTAPQSDKVIPLLHIRHHHFAHEEQVKNSDQGNDFVIKEKRARKNERRARKNPLPASDLVKVPVDSSAPLEQQITSILKKINEMSPEERAKVLAQIQANLSRIQEHLVQFVKAVSSKTHAGSGEQPQFDAWNSSIFMEYTSFAKTEMDQNSKIMVGWEDQQKAQNLILQDAAAKQKENANTVTTSKSPSILASGIVALICLVAVGVVLGIVTGGIGAGVVFTAVACAAAGGLGTYFGTQYALDHKDGGFASQYLDGFSFMVDPNTPNNGLISKVGSENYFWSAVTQAANNQISSGSQTNVVNASSNDTTLGQQASQVIQAMGQILRIQLTR